MKLPKRLILLGIVVVSTLTVCVVALAKGWVEPETIQSVVERSGSLGMLTYVVAVVVIELLWLPRMWGLMAGGILFGPLVGGLLSWVADMLGGAVCYAISRTTGRAWVARVLKRRPKAARIVDLLAIKRGTLTMAFLRICPFGHYTTVSYAAGMSGVRLSPYLIGTAIGLLPGAALYPFIGDAALSPTSPAFAISLFVLLVLLLVTAAVTRRIFASHEAAPASTTKIETQSGETRRESAALGTATRSE